MARRSRPSWPEQDRPDPRHECRPSPHSIIIRAGGNGVSASGGANPGVPFEQATVGDLTVAVAASGGAQLISLGDTDRYTQADGSLSSTGRQPHPRRSSSSYSSPRPTRCWSEMTRQPRARPDLPQGRSRRRHGAAVASGHRSPLAQGHLTRVHADGSAWQDSDGDPFAVLPGEAEPDNDSAPTTTTPGHGQRTASWPVTSRKPPNGQEDQPPRPRGTHPARHGPTMRSRSALPPRKRRTADPRRTPRACTPPEIKPDVPGVVLGEAGGCEHPEQPGHLRLRPAGRADHADRHVSDVPESGIEQPVSGVQLAITPVGGGSAVVSNPTLTEIDQATYPYVWSPPQSTLAGDYVATWTSTSPAWTITQVVRWCRCRRRRRILACTPRSRSTGSGSTTC